MSGTAGSTVMSTVTETLATSTPAHVSTEPTTSGVTVSSTINTESTAFGSSSTAIPVFPRLVEFVFILDDSNCDTSFDISSQKNTITNVLSNYTISPDGIHVANPHSILSTGLGYIFLTDLSALTDTYLLDCSRPPDSTFTIDKALRKSMSFAYKYARNESEALVFVVFTLNNGTSMMTDDHGAAMNASLAYREKCMDPGKVEIIQINPGPGRVNQELGNHFFKYDDPDLYNKFLNVVKNAEIYDKSAVLESDCIDPINPNFKSDEILRF
uniref:VWFA domain-containing protein n=1 Tax=Panagrolaimus davidi TaxID=227884 RepID=A0A914Q3G2_9BILA